jgi:hypothetical protein
MPVPPEVTDELIREAGRITESIAEQQYVHSPITALTPKDVFEPGMGVEQFSWRFDRGAVTSNYGWADVGVNSTNSVNSCNPLADIVSNPQTLFPFKLRQRAYESQNLCWNDVYTAKDPARQIQGLYRNLSATVLNAWEEEDRDQYIDKSEHKIVFAGGNLIDQEASFATVAADSQATQDLLARLRDKLMYEGAAGRFESAIGKQDGAPVFALLTSTEQIQYLDQGTGVRDDLRWNPNKVGELLEPFSTTRVRNGFAYYADPKAPRYTYSGGYTRVPFYSTVTDSTNGQPRLIPNPAYSAAEYELMIIYNKDVMTRLMPLPTIASSTANFDRQYSAGEVEWLNIPHRTENPDGNTGFFRAVLKAAYRSDNPSVGFVVMVRRCPFNITRRTCTGS